MKQGDSREFTATEIIIDTETEVMLLVKDAVRFVVKMLSFSKDLEELLEKNLKDIKNEDLRKTARESLRRFAYEELEKLNLRLKLRNIPLMVALLSQRGEGLQISDKKVNEMQQQMNEIFLGIPRGEKDNAFTNLGNSQAKVSNRRSLYGHSELVARYEERNEMLDKLKKETKLVVCSTHADCSDRCSRWQGKVYSLDGTEGTTTDGRHYDPLEKATEDETYGRHNGLLGYNCRHKLMPYKKGLKPMFVSSKERNRQSELTGQQRALEREIRQAKRQMLIAKGENKDKYRVNKQKVQNLMNKYKEFCIKYNRVQYRSRLQVDDSN